MYNEICQYLPTEGEKENNDIIRVYVDRKGQYRRPSYVLLWTLLYDGKLNDAMLPAAAQQVSEDWILMQDDWMDSNKLRRNNDSAHILYGNSETINASDSLHIINWRIVKDAMDKLDTSRGSKYFKKFSDILLTTCTGQYLDIKLSARSDITKFTEEDYFKSIHAKSAYYSVYGPMQCGAIIANASDEIINAIPQYGVPAGYAFQITDDILDCTSTKEELGKCIGNDIREGAKTIMLLYAVQKASSSTLVKIKSIYEKPRENKTESDIQYILDKFRELECYKDAQNYAEKFSLEAKETFNKITHNIHESNIKDIARDSITHLAKRKK